MNFNPKIVKNKIVKYIYFKGVPKVIFRKIRHFFEFSFFYVISLLFPITKYMGHIIWQIKTDSQNLFWYMFGVGIWWWPRVTSAASGDLVLVLKSIFPEVL